MKPHRLALHPSLPKRVTDLSRLNHEISVEAPFLFFVGTAELRVNKVGTSAWSQPQGASPMHPFPEDHYSEPCRGGLFALGSWQRPIPSVHNGTSQHSDHGSHILRVRVCHVSLDDVVEFEVRSINAA